MTWMVFSKLYFDTNGCDIVVIVRGFSIGSEFTLGYG